MSEGVPKKKAAAARSKKPTDHPKYAEMVKAAVEALKERGGSSRQAILKYIAKHYNVGPDEKIINQHLKMSLRAGVKSGSLKQAKGVGASGSFRMGESPKKGKAKKVKKAKPASAARKPKKAAADKKLKAQKKQASPKKAARPKKAAAKGKKDAARTKKVAAKPKATAAKTKKAAAKPKKAAAKTKKTAAKR